MIARLIIEVLRGHGLQGCFKTEKNGNEPRAEWTETTANWRKISVAIEHVFPNMERGKLENGEDNPFMSVSFGFDCVLSWDHADTWKVSFDPFGEPLEAERSELKKIFERAFNRGHPLKKEEMYLYVDISALCTFIPLFLEFRKVYPMTE